jgi:TRAP transporter TAXI family solute receptor
MTMLSMCSKGEAALRGMRIVPILAGWALGVGSALAQVPDVVTFAVSPEGTSGYLIAAGYSKVINAQTSIKKVVLQPFSSATAWPVRMNAGEVNFSQHCGYEQVLEAYTGTGPFKQVGAQRNIRNVATTYGLPWSIHMIDPAIKTIADLRRKSIFVQVSHSDHVTALRVLLKSAGLDYNRDIRVLPFREPGEALQGLASGRGDGIAFGLIPGLVELKQSKGMHSLAIPVELARNVQAEDPVWGYTVVGKGKGPLAPPEDVPILEIECGIAAAAQTSAEAVYQVLKTLLDHHASWKDVHPLAAQTTRTKALQVVVVPFHDGAVRFYREAGIWTPELDARQSALLHQK